MRFLFWKGMSENFSKLFSIFFQTRSNLLQREELFILRFVILIHGERLKRKPCGKKGSMGSDIISNTELLSFRLQTPVSAFLVMNWKLCSNRFIKLIVP